MRIIEDSMWVYFLIDTDPYFDEQKGGKWMYYFTDEGFTKEICKAAIEKGVVTECKYGKISKYKGDNGRRVACFYLDDDDTEGHHRVIRFFLENGLIPKTKSGRLHNISFKHNAQTRAGEYGDKYKSDLKLDKFVDLATGQFK